MTAKAAVRKLGERESDQDATTTVAVCEDIASLSAVKRPRVQVCEICVKTGDSWVHLRTCQICGVTLCCDSSPNHHARTHARSSAHPVVASAEPGERWLYCYRDEVYAEY